MPHPTHATLNDWIAREAIPFSLDPPASLNAAVDAMMTTLGGSVDLLGFGEALHGGEDLLILRNRLFKQLVEAHGYTAIAVESSFPRGQLVDGYAAGRGPASYEAVGEDGFSHGFGRLDANRELVAWMRAYNADPAHRTKLRFYGFDTPTEFGSSDSPRRLLAFVLDYLTSADSAAGRAYRERVEPLLGEDGGWEDPATVFDPTKSIGRSPAAAALRVATEDLIADLQRRRPELTALSGSDRYREVMHYAAAARWLLAYHAGLAETSDDRVSRLLGMRDAMMADNLAYMVSRERGRGGKVLAFAHNEHLQRGKAEWQFGTNLWRWSPAGAHLDTLFGSRYAVIGSAVGSRMRTASAGPSPAPLKHFSPPPPGREGSSRHTGGRGFPPGLFPPARGARRTRATSRSPARASPSSTGSRSSTPQDTPAVDRRYSPRSSRPPRTGYSGTLDSFMRGRRTEQSGDTSPMNRRNRGLHRDLHNTLSPRHSGRRERRAVTIASSS